MPTAILLDLDNTVYAYAPCHEAGLQAAFRASGDTDEATFRADYHTARDQAKHAIRDTGAAHCRLLYFKTFWENRTGRTQLAKTLALYHAYWAAYHAAMVPDDGMLACLTAWKDAGIPLAWVSDFTTEQQFLKLQTLGLEGVVDYLITAEEVGAVKPDPRGVDLALAKLGVEPSPAVWFIGDDTKRDCGVAEARGLTFLWRDRTDTGFWRTLSGSPIIGG